MKSIIAEPIIHTDLAEFYSLWRDACLGRWASEVDEIKFLLEILSESKQVRSIIDLGGGIGLHSSALKTQGFDVTLLDKSETALHIAKRNRPQLKTVNCSLENINLKDHFDVGICMFSSMNYLLDERDISHFYHWLNTHIKELVILDQLNTHRLARVSSDNSQADDKHFRLNVLREWHFEGDIMHTSFVYEFIDKESEATKIINDAQSQKFLTLDEITAYMGKQWRAVAVLGDCNLKSPFDPDKSSRMVSIFKRIR